MIHELTRTIGFVLTHPLGCRTKLRSLSRLAYWQVRINLSQGPHKVTFVNQTQLWARKGEAGVTGNIYVGLHEFSDMAFVAHMLREGDLFADIGANAGSYTILATGVAGARTIAVEPVPSTQQRLEENISLNGVTHLVTVRACALSAQSGSVEITIDADSTNRIIATRDGRTDVLLPANMTCVPAMPANKVFEKEKPIVAKIDVEGHEEELLKGAGDLLSSSDLKAIVIELSDRRGNSAVELLERCGFQSVKYHPFDRRMTKTEPVLGKGNTLFIRSVDWQFVSNRVVKAKSIYVHGQTI